MKSLFLIIFLVIFSLSSACKETTTDDPEATNTDTSETEQTDDETSGSESETEEEACTFALTSADMPEGQLVPTSFTAGIVDELCTGTGSNTSPALSWSCAPGTGVSSFAVTMWDIDFNAFDGDDYIHWVVYNIASDTTGLARAAGDPSGGNLPVGAKHGSNDSGDSFTAAIAGYFGPCPGGANHRYQFTVSALSIENLENDVELAEIGIANATPTQFREAIERHSLGSSTLTRNSTGE
jgi:Raf kinase inhibitor-like YbhB/YbcL family protein